MKFVISRDMRLVGLKFYTDVGTIVICFRIATFTGVPRSPGSEAKCSLSFN
jgi:hypothetical protein